MSSDLAALCAMVLVFCKICINNRCFSANNINTYIFHEYAYLNKYILLLLLFFWLGFYLFISFCLKCLMP